MADGFSKQDADSALNTTASSDYNTAPSEEEQITLFAPFEPHRGSGKRFQRSYELETSDPSSKEIEFRSSQSQTGGNATVIFKKLKAAMGSGASSTSSYSPTSTPSPAQFRAASSKNNRSGALNVQVNVLPPEERGSKGRFQYEGQNSSSVSSNAVSSNGGRPTSEGGTGKSHMVSDDPRISITSYTDAHRRAGYEAPTRRGGDRGSGRPDGGGAVNKTEMLKRFGNIANSKVQVHTIQCNRSINKG